MLAWLLQKLGQRTIWYCFLREHGLSGAECRKKEARKAERKHNRAQRRPEGECLQVMESTQSTSRETECQLVPEGFSGLFYI